MLGAFMGYGLLMVVTPADIFRPLNATGPNLCVTEPYAELSPIVALAMEYISTSILIFIVGGVWDPRNAQYQDSIPLKFGFAITAIGMILGPFTGARLAKIEQFSPQKKTLYKQINCCFF